MVPACQVVLEKRPLNRCISSSSSSSKHISGCIAVVSVVGGAELFELCVHRARPRSTVGVRRDDDDGVGVERHLSRRVCDASAVHDHAVLHDVCHRRHTDAAAHGHHQVSDNLSVILTATIRYKCAVVIDEF